ncbi:MAG: hypothetical protein AAFY99_07625 [Pseudomonadota bacterium]
MILAGAVTGTFMAVRGGYFLNRFYKNYQDEISSDSEVGGDVNESSQTVRPAEETSQIALDGNESTVGSEGTSRLDDESSDGFSFDWKAFKLSAQASASAAGKAAWRAAVETVEWNMFGDLKSFVEDAFSTGGKSQEVPTEISIPNSSQRSDILEEYLADRPVPYRSARHSGFGDGGILLDELDADSRSDGIDPPYSASLSARFQKTIGVLSKALFGDSTAEQDYDYSTISSTSDSQTSSISSLFQPAHGQFGVSDELYLLDERREMDTRSL